MSEPQKTTARAFLRKLLSPADHKVRIHKAEGELSTGPQDPNTIEHGTALQCAFRQAWQRVESGQETVVEVLVPKGIERHLARSWKSESFRSVWGVSVTEVRHLREILVLGNNGRIVGIRVPLYWLTPIQKVDEHE